MAPVRRSETAAFLAALRAGVAACAIGLAFAGAAQAQAQPPLDVSVPADAKMLLAADQLIYDHDSSLVIATGGVQIDYGGYQLVAERVEYDQRTGRVRASGKVEMLEPGGNRIYADNLDVTDDFSDGFVNALRIETPDNTRIIAESAERSGGTETTFNNGVYTACEPCRENPAKAPFWQIKARKVIQNGVTQTVRLERATFELFGMPIAFLPYLELPDHQAKRKSGFLQPSFSVTDELGFGAGIPYYYVISPSMDVTVTGTGYTKQGFLAEGEFRQRFENGEVILRMAGISQNNPDNFDASAGYSTVDGSVTERGFIASEAKFEINPRWTFGWDVMLQSDRNFARTYGLQGYGDVRHTSEVYLTGLANRSFFDLRAYKFDVQDDWIDSTQDKEQALVYPVLDYNRISPRSVAGGELALNVNVQNLSRENEDRLGVLERYPGLEGESARLTAELEWKRTFTTAQGLRLTTLLAARADGNYLDLTGPSGTYSGLESNGSTGRGMVTAGLEASYPILMTTANSTHVIEPIAQVFVRPNEQLSGGLPNEDAQSFVFDTTSLFDRDKFSGYDRIEGGTRANVGVRYTGSYSNGMTTFATFGQSYHLAGLNSFTTTDLVGAGLDSGLESRASDFVAMAGVTSPAGITLSGSGRFDNEGLSLKRGDLTAGLARGPFSGTFTYSDVAAQKGYGATQDRRELKGAATLRFTENWSVSGAASYDLERQKFYRSGVGLAYGDECVEFAISYQRLLDDNKPETRDWSIAARLSFRTLGDINYSTVDENLF
ncbi:LPS-assembly protein [Hoeflea marina]|uniref:LPS-assembly protein LptD n=1 Tax=Hoeflea marina TaxID=274592 RepID=A0A317PND9_9HYPH|nr:LPS-assembly protein LptD [Hoeflea marina]PWW02286.1 LPS-assembly protein [Hoeflea marina]